MSEYKFIRTHYGKLHGVPVYIDMTNESAPGIEAKNIFFEIALDIMEGLFGIFCALRCAMDPYFEPHFAVRIDGEYED